MSRSTTVSLTGNYTGWEFTARMVSVGEYRRIKENLNLDAALEFLVDILESWNFVDEKGKPLGKPSVATIAYLPLELPLLMVSAYLSKLITVPTELRTALMGAAHVGHGAPEELFWSQICQFYHCLPSQLDNEDADRILLYFQVQNIYDGHRNTK